MSKTESLTDRHVWVVTGPTSGIGRLTALALAEHGEVILVGRDQGKLAEVEATIKQKGQQALSVICDLSDIASVERAAAKIVALKLPIAGVLNNAGIFPLRAMKNSRGWDLAFATNHLGPFAFTEALIPHLADGTTILFVASAVEDPDRKFAVAAGFRGGRYISAQASARGEWQHGGSSMLGADAYATSKQCSIATMMAFARENPRLHINAIEPGFMPNTGLGRDANGFLRFLSHYIFPLLAPFIRYMSTPKRAARVITTILTDRPGQTGLYYDQDGKPMLGSKLVRDPAFQTRVVAETRELLATNLQSPHQASPKSEL